VLLGRTQGLQFTSEVTMLPLSGHRYQAAVLSGSSCKQSPHFNASTADQPVMSTEHSPNQQENSGTPFCLTIERVNSEPLCEGGAPLFSGPPSRPMLVGLASGSTCASPSFASSSKLPAVSLHSLASFIDAASTRLFYLRSDVGRRRITDVAQRRVTDVTRRRIPNAERTADHWPQTQWPTLDKPTRASLTGINMKARISVSWKGRSVADEQNIGVNVLPDMNTLQFVFLRIKFLTFLALMLFITPHTILISQKLIQRF